MNSREEQYVAEHSFLRARLLSGQKPTSEPNYPRMLTGAVQRRFLTMLAGSHGRKVLENRDFTATLDLFRVRDKEGGMVDTLEINDELEDLSRSWKEPDQGQDHSPHQ